MIRPNIAENLFYPGNADKLKNTLAAFMPKPAPATAIMAMVPHAGYVYSGALAGEALQRVEIPPVVLLVGPNHRGAGASAAFSAYDAWHTPLGNVPLAKKLIQEFLAKEPLLIEDEAPHKNEHSLEVIIPFLKYLNPEVTIAPLSLGRLSLNESMQVGRSLGQVISGFKQKTLIVASTDMSHYLTASQAAEQDKAALDQVLQLNPVDLYKTVARLNITMCGVLPVIAGLAAALDLGARQATLVGYTNSGAASGDLNHVVGYAGVIITNDIL